MMSNAEGIDVSEYVPLTWNGTDFGMVKATEGTYYFNSSFARNWEDMGKIRGDFPRFAYHYARPSQDPSLQAKYLVNAVKDHGLRQHDHFVLDIEVSDDKPPVDVSFWGYTFCREVNRLAPGHRCLVYTYVDFADRGYCAKLGSWFLWIADYQVSSPAVPPPWKQWTFWQHQGGKDVDLDEFNGNIARLAEFTSHAGVA